MPAGALQSFRWRIREPWRNIRHRSVQRFVEGAPPSAGRIDVSYPTMNRASGTLGHRYFDTYATRYKTLEIKTLDAGRILQSSYRRAWKTPTQRWTPERLMFASAFWASDRASPTPPLAVLLNVCVR